MAYIGTIKSWDAQKGYGAISRGDGDDVSLTIRDFVGAGELAVGVDVEFDIKPWPNDDQATNVRILVAPTDDPTPPPPPTTVPLLRTFNPGTGDHFYTTSVTERDNTVAHLGYKDEGIACYV